MRSFSTIVRPIVMVAILVGLAECSGLPSLDSLDLDSLFSTKKKLPGERHEVFPGGVPGVPQGVPKQQLGSNPSEPAADLSQAAQTPAPAEPEKPKAAPKRKAVARKIRKPTEPAATNITVAPSVRAAPAPVAAWPSVAPAAQVAPAAAPWPNPAPSPQAAWPTQ